MSFSKLQKSTRRTNVANRGTFACRTVTTIENRYINVTFSETFKCSSNLEHINLWIYGKDIYIYGCMDGIFEYTDIWRKICTYKCAQIRNINQWFNGWNIVIHRYRAQSLEHTHVQQK